MAEKLLSKEEVLKIAKLARLELSEAEVALYQRRLGRVLGYMHELDALKAPGHGSVKHVPKDAVAMREDKVMEFKGVAEILANAPEIEERSFVLPTVIDQQ